MYSKCQKCGKRLSDPESMERGYGPECWSKITGIDIRTNTIGEDMENYDLPGQMTFDDFPEWIPEEMKGE